MDRGGHRRGGSALAAGWGVRAGFDAHMVGQRETGNETYALGLLHGFDRIRFAVDSYSMRPLASSIHRQHHIWPGSSFVRIPLIMPLLAVRDRLDLFHATYVLPPVLPCAGVVTVHDVSFALHPEWFPPRVREMLSLHVPRSLRHASHVIAISEQTKRDIVELYGIEPSKVAVTHLAPRPSLGRLAAEPDSAKPVFLYVGNLEPRKDVETVLRALAILRDRRTEAQLVLVGKASAYRQHLEQLSRQLRLDHLVRFAGYVPDEELADFYRGSIALVHPALHEGFGLTPLEAMARGVPVIAADAPALPEVIGDAGLLVPAGSPEAWADAMGRLLDNQSLRVDLRRKGLERSQHFSWERCARETIEVYRTALDAC